MEVKGRMIRTERRQGNLQVKDLWRTYSSSLSLFIQYSARDYLCTFLDSSHWLAWFKGSETYKLVDNHEMEGTNALTFKLLFMESDRRRDVWLV
jgi:hypothetical protein